MVVTKSAGYKHFSGKVVDWKNIIWEFSETKTKVKGTDLFFLSKKQKIVNNSRNRILYLA